MADDYVQVPVDSTGKKLQTKENVIGANTVHSEAVFITTDTGASLNPATEATLATVHGHVDSIDGKITACNTGAVVVLSGNVTSNAQNIATETTLGTVHGHVDSIDGKMVSGTTIGRVETIQNCTYLHAYFDAGASGNLVANVVNKVIKLHFLTIQAQGTVVVNLNDGNGGAQLAEWSFQAREGTVYSFAQYPAHYLQTSVNTALYVTLSAGVTVTINCIYSADDAS